jgi:hypothetical protein
VNPHRLLRLFILTIVTITILSGCAFKVPLEVDAAKDMRRTFQNSKKLPIKVGLYIDDEMRNYVYKQQKMGMIFYMTVGEYVFSISKSMALEMFEEVIYVDSLPPFTDSYMPDVDAVVKPEILCCYGNAIGTLSGNIEVEISFRVIAYDLCGKILWEDIAVGKKRSEKIDFVSSFFGGMTDIGNIGYQAAFSAATKIINDFHASPPKELSSFLEIKRLSSLGSRNISSDHDLFNFFYEKGLFLFKRKNYYHALLSLKNAARIDPNDLSTMYNIGSCLTHIGQKKKALQQLSQVVIRAPGSDAAASAKALIERLEEPLKIGVVAVNKKRKNKYISPEFLEGSLRQAFVDSQMYNIADIIKHGPPNSLQLNQTMKQFLDRCYGKGIRIVVFAESSFSSHPARCAQVNQGDIATELEVKIVAHVFPTRLKKIEDVFSLEERTLSRQTVATEQTAIKRELIQRGTKRLVLRLLTKDIF